MSPSGPAQTRVGHENPMRTDAHRPTIAHEKPMRTNAHWPNVTCEKWVRINGANLASPDDSSRMSSAERAQTARASNTCLARLRAPFGPQVRRQKSEVRGQSSAGTRPTSPHRHIAKSPNCPHLLYDSLSMTADSRPTLRLGHSPDPDDAFMWWPLLEIPRLASPRIDTG